MANQVQIIISALDRTQGFRSVLDNFKRLENGGKSLSTAMSYLGGVALLGLGTAALGVAAALAAMTYDAIKTADETGRLAQQAGLAVEEFSRLSYAAGLAEVSQEQLVKASKAYASQAVKSGEASKSFSEALLETADLFAAAADGNEKLTLASAKFGKQGQALIPLLNQGADAIRAQMQESDELGATIGEKFARDADQFLDNLDRIKAAVRGVANTIAQESLPALTAWTEATLKFIKINGGVGPTVNNTATAVATLHPSLMALVGAWNLVNGAVQKFNDGSTLPKPPPDTLVNPEDVAKAKAMLEDLQLSQFRGGVALIEQQDAILRKRLDDIVKLQISEEQALEYARTAREVHEQKTTELKYTGEQQRAQLDEYFRNGEVNNYIKALQSMQGARLADLAASQQVIQTYQQLWENSFANIGNSLRSFSANALTTFSDGFGTAIANIATGVQSVEEAFKQLGSQMLGMLAKWLAQLVINTLLAAALQTTVSAAAIAAMSPVLAMNTAAATAAAIATFGGATSAAAGVPIAMAANVASANVIAGLGGIAHGGLDFVPRQSTFLLDRGERVLQPPANRDLTEFLSRQGRNSGSQTIELYLDGRRLAEWINDGTRDGRIQLSARD